MNIQEIQRLLAVAKTLASAAQTPPTEEEAFKIGAELMFIGQQLTQESGFKLQPGTIEGKMLLRSILDTVTGEPLPPEIIDEFMTEPDIFSQNTDTQN